jgi:hypothetical protein
MSSHSLQRRVREPESCGEPRMVRQALLIGLQELSEKRRLQCHDEFPEIPVLRL